MERTEILLTLVLVISLLSLWFSYKNYERKMRKYHHRKCGCGYFSEGYSGGERSGAARARAAIQERERQARQQENNQNFSKDQTQDLNIFPCVINPAAPGCGAFCEEFPERCFPPKN